MNGILSESEIMAAFQSAGLDPSSLTDGDRLTAAFQSELEQNIRNADVAPTELTPEQIKGMAKKAMEAAGTRLRAGETTTQLRARLMAEAQKMGADHDPTTLLQIGFKVAQPTHEPERPKDITGITSPSELLKIAFSKKRG